MIVIDDIKKKRVGEKEEPRARVIYSVYVCARVLFFFFF